MALDEHHRLFRTDAGGQPIQRHLRGVVAQVLELLQSRQRVQVYDAINALVIILQRDIVLDGPQIIPQVLTPGRPSAGEDTTFFRHELNPLTRKIGTRITRKNPDGTEKLKIRKI